MLKVLFFIGALTICFTSCDVRKKDLRPGVNGLPQEEKAPAPIKDPTTVQLIDSAYNFGHAKDGDIIEYNYRFKNTGTKPLVITHASASCGCTVPEKPEQPILPGETGFIKVKFTTANRVGEAHKTITIESNAEPAFPVLALTGTIDAKDGNK
jgi:hypothetical protein